MLSSNPKKMDKLELNDLPAVEKMPGFKGKFIHTDTMTLAYWTIAEGSILPTHHHHHEQVINMMEGELELILDGVTHRLTAGDILVIPSNRPHGGKAITEVKVLDVFHPVREDYR